MTLANGKRNIHKGFIPALIIMALIYCTSFRDIYILIACILSMALLFFSFRVQNWRLVAHERTIEELRKSEEHLRLAVSESELGTWDSNLLTGERAWSDQLGEIFGLPPNIPMTYEVFLSCLHPEDRERVAETARQSCDPAGTGRYFVEYRILRPDGELRWVAASGRAFFGMVNGKYKAVRITGGVLDITRRRHLEDALRKSEGKHGTVSTRREMGFSIARDKPLQTKQSPYARNDIMVSRRRKYHPQAAPV
jgi:PAS domain S-box-containing protein